MAVNKVIYDGSTLMDVTDTTAEASDVSSGKVFYSKAGVRTVGNYTPVEEFEDLTDVFIIECTTENNTPVVDKTWTEITTAYNAGKMVYAKCYDQFFLLGALHSSSVDSQGYAYFYSPSAWFDPNLSPYYGGQWYFYDGCIVIWDTTWSGQDGKITSWEYCDMPDKVRVTTYYTPSLDSNSFVLQQINNDAGNSIFMSRYDQNGSSTFTMGSGGIDITSTLGVRIQNVVAPTNNMDVATKQYVDTAVSGVSSSLMLTATVNNTTVTFTGATPSEVYTAVSGGALVQATIPLVWGDGIFDLKEYNYDSSSGDYYFIFSNVTSDMGRPQNRLVQCNLSTGSATSWTGSLQESCLVGASIFEDVAGVFIDDTTLANNQILRYDVDYGSFVNADAPQDNNTTYTISISGNVITLTPSTGTAQTITLPVYNGGVT